MKLIINGEEKEIASGITIHELLEQLEVKDKVMACAVNMEIVKKENWKSYTPQDGDKLEVLEFVGGG
jgi:sulfur carrier protein